MLYYANVMRSSALMAHYNMLMLVLRYENAFVILCYAMSCKTYAMLMLSYVDVTFCSAVANALL